MLKRFTVYHYLGCVLVVYLLTSLFLPVSRDQTAQFHTSLTAYRLALTSVVVLLGLIWLATLYGYSKIRRYSETIANAKEGRHIKRMAYGLAIFAFGMPLASILSSVLRSIGVGHPGFQFAATVISSYASLVYILVAILFISLGANGLSQLVKHRPSQLFIYIFAAVFITLGVAYLYVVFTHLSGNNDPDSHKTIYALSPWVLLTTYIAPYIFTWVFGMLAVYETYLYNVKVTGIIYKRAWSFFSAGLLIIILTSIGVQFLGSLYRHVAGLRFSAVLLIIYPLIVIIGLGFLLIAFGAKRLQKIEEV